MTDINNFIDEDLLKSINDINQGIINIAKSIDKKLVPAFGRLEESQSKAGKEVVDNQTKRKKLTEEEAKALKITKQQEDASAALEKQRQQGLKILAKIEDAERNMQKALDKEVKSIKDAREQNKALRKIREDVDTTTEAGAKTLKEYNELIDKNDELIKENVDSYSQLKIGIGGYEDAIKSALEGTQAFSGGAGNIINNFTTISQQEGGVKSFFKTFVQGIGSAAKAGLKFIATPIGAVIFAIVAAITLFTAAIKRNQTSSDTFSKIWSGITIVIEEVIGRVFKLAGAIGKLLALDFKGFKEDAVGAFTGFGKAMIFAFNEGQKLKQLQIDLEKSTIKSTEAIVKFNAEAEKQSIIADDATKSFAEREKAAAISREEGAKAIKEQIELDRQALAIIDIQVEQARRQGKLNRELEQERADASAQFIQSESDLVNLQLENSKTINELKQDRLEKDLDILIDGFDNVKTINEQIIADEKNTFQERQRLLTNTATLAKDSFDKQIETIKQFTDVQFSEKELLAEQDAVLLNQRIRELGLSEIIEGRLLEVIRERRIAIQDLNVAQGDLVDSLVKIEEESLNLLEVDKMIAEEQKAIEDKQVADDAARLQIGIDNAQKEVEIQQEKANRIIDISTSMGEALGALASGQIKSFKEFAKEILFLALDALEKRILLTQVEILAKDVASKGFLGVATAAVKFGLIKAAFAGVKGIVGSFAKGTENSPGGVAELAERGRELVKNPDGTVWMAENRGLYNLQKGSTVVTNQKTESIMNDKNMVRELKLTRKAIQNQPRQRTESRFDARRAAYWDMYNSRRMN